MARYKDFEDFDTKHPKLGALLLSPFAQQNRFLGEMFGRVSTRQNISPKQLGAMKKFLKTKDAPSWKKGERWRSIEIRITKLDEKRPEESRLVFVRDNVTRGKIQVPQRQFDRCANRLASLADGEALSGFINATIVWVSDDDKFPILEGDIEALSTVSEEHFTESQSIPEEQQGRPLTEVFNEIAETLQSEPQPFKGGIITNSPLQHFLPDFKDWKKAPAFSL